MNEAIGRALTLCGQNYTVKSGPPSADPQPCGFSKNSCWPKMSLQNLIAERSHENCKYLDNQLPAPECLFHTWIMALSEPPCYAMLAMILILCVRSYPVQQTLANPQQHGPVWVLLVWLHHLGHAGTYCAVWLCSLASQGWQWSAGATGATWPSYQDLSPSSKSPRHIVMAMKEVRDSLQKHPQNAKALARNSTLSPLLHTLGQTNHKPAHTQGSLFYSLRYKNHKLTRKGNSHESRGFICPTS